MHKVDTKSCEKRETKIYWYLSCHSHNRPWRCLFVFNAHPPGQGSFNLLGIYPTLPSRTKIIQTPFCGHLPMTYQSRWFSKERVPYYHTHHYLLTYYYLLGMYVLLWHIGWAYTLWFSVGFLRSCYTRCTLLYISNSFVVYLVSWDACLFSLFLSVMAFNHTMLTIPYFHVKSWN